jgi:hypothetical protein
MNWGAVPSPHAVARTGIGAATRLGSRFRQRLGQVAPHLTPVLGDVEQSSISARQFRTLVVRPQLCAAVGLTE